MCSTKILESYLNHGYYPHKNKIAAYTVHNFGLKNQNTSA